MSGASWYYCNLLDEASAVVPIVQALQNATNSDVKGFTGRRIVKLAPGTSINDDELAVARSAYVLVAATSDSTTDVVKKVEGESKVSATVIEQVVSMKSLAAATVQTSVAKPEVVAEEIAIKEVCKSEDTCASEEAIVDRIPGSDVEEQLNSDVVRTLAGKEDAATVKASVENANENPETGGVAGNEVGEPSVNHAMAQGVNLVDIEQVADEPISEPPMAEDVATKKPFFATSTTSSAPLKKVAAKDLTGEVILESAKVASSEALILEGINQNSAEVDESFAIGEIKAVHGEDEKASVKVVSEDESETETQSEKSEGNTLERVKCLSVTKDVNEPDSEIDETMVIDPIVAAKENAEQTSSFGFIPEQLRKNSYAVSSVAVAVTTAIVATLMARR